MKKQITLWRFFRFTCARACRHGQPWKLKCRGQSSGKKNSHSCDLSTSQRWDCTDFVTVCEIRTIIACCLFLQCLAHINTVYLKYKLITMRKIAGSYVLLAGFVAFRLWANARNVRLYYPYWQYTDHFIFRFVSLLWLRSILRLF